MFQLTSVPVLSDGVAIFLSSIVVLTANGQFLGCVTVTFSGRYVVDLRSVTYCCVLTGFIVFLLLNKRLLVQCYF